MKTLLKIKGKKKNQMYNMTDVEKLLENLNDILIVFVFNLKGKDSKVTISKKTFLRDFPSQFSKIIDISQQRIRILKDKIVYDIYIEEFEEEINRTFKVQVF